MPFFFGHIFPTKIGPIKFPCPAMGPRFWYIAHAIYRRRGFGTAGSVSLPGFFSKTHMSSRGGPSCGKDWDLLKTTWGANPSWSLPLKNHEKRTWDWKMIHFGFGVETSSPKCGHKVLLYTETLLHTWHWKMIQLKAPGRWFTCFQRQTNGLSSRHHQHGLQGMKCDMSNEKQNMGDEILPSYVGIIP